MKKVRKIIGLLPVIGFLLLSVTACKEEKKPMPKLKSMGACDLDITLLKAYAEYDKQPETDRLPHNVYVFKIKNLSGAEQHLFQTDSNGFYEYLNMEILAAPVADSIPMERLTFAPAFCNLILKAHDSLVVYGFGKSISIPPFIARNLLIRNTGKRVFLFRYASPDTLIAEHRAEFKLIQKSPSFIVDTVSTEAIHFKSKVKQAEAGK